MNVPLTWLICGSQVYCLIEIINLLMGASLLALAKSPYYRRAYKQASPTQRFLARRTTFLAPILPPACDDGSAAKNFPGIRTSWPARKRKLGWLNSTHCNITIFLHSIAQQRFLWPLLNSTSRFSVDREKVYLVLLCHYFQDFFTTACKFNSSRKFSLFFSRYIPLQPPLSLNFAIHTFLGFVHGEIQSYKLWTPVFSGYFRNVFIVFIISFCLCLFLVQNTVPFEKLNTI